MTDAHPQDARPRGPELAAVIDYLIAGTPPVPVRLYRAVDAARPMLVYLHGEPPRLDAHDRLFRRLAAGADVAVLAVDHGGGPERAAAAVRWAFASANGKVGIGGDGAGGRLAALACVALRDGGFALPAAQVIVCPAAGLPASDLTALPPAVVVTAEEDPLHAEGDAFAARLAEAGVAVEHRCEAGLGAGFLPQGDRDSPRAASRSGHLFTDIAAALYSARPIAG